MTADLERVLADYLERRERGEAPDKQTFLAAHPELNPALGAALANLELAEGKLDAVAGLYPDRVGHYALKGEIARGGMGRVLAAIDTRVPGQRVALKLLDAAHALSERARKRFEREANILAGLAHPGVVRVLEAGVHESPPWIAMEFVEGQTLAAELRGQNPRLSTAAGCAGTLTPMRAATIAAQLARAVAAVHAAGLLHRDIKPANVILTPTGRAVLVDFGLVHDESSATLTRTGDLLGTPQYMAPEQAHGRHADERTDVYGIGAVLYEMLSGSAPHGSGEAWLVLERIRRQGVLPLHKRAPEIPPDLERIVMRALAFRRSRRTASAVALARDLESFIAGDRVAARAPSAFERLENLGRAHARKLPLLALLPLLLLGAWFSKQKWQEQARGRRAELVGELLGAWLAEDAALAQIAATELLEQSSFAGQGKLIAAIARNEPVELDQEQPAVAIEQGWNELCAERYVEAITAFQLAKLELPQSPLPMVLLARAAERARELELAAREYQAALVLLPTSAELQARIGKVHYASENNSEAELAVRKAIALAPQEGRYYFDLARLLFRTGQYAAGLDAALRGRELRGAAVNTLELQILAAGFDQAKRHPEAQEVLLEVLAQKPADARTLYNLAYSYALDHDLIEARDTYLKIEQGRQVSAGLASAAWLMAGSNRQSCQECADYYNKHPDLLDFNRAEQLAIQALRLNDSDDVPNVAVDVALLLEHSTGIRQQLEELQSEERDVRRLGVLEKALRRLRE